MIVVWRISTHCNLACPFCAYDRSRPIARVHADPVAIRAFCIALADYQRTFAEPVLLSWLGGEPLLWRELPGLTAFARSLGLRVSATTNGTTLGSSAVRRHLLEHYAELTVSLDAPDATHDTLRGWPGGFPRLQASVSALVLERKAGGHPLKIRINTLLQRSNLDTFPLLAREVARWGADELTFNALGGRDRPEYFPAERLHPEQLNGFPKVLDQLREELAPRGLIIQGSPRYVQRLLAGAAGEAHPVVDCAPGRKFLFVDEAGLVSPCSFTGPEFGRPLAELHSAAAIASLPQQFQEIRNRHPPHVCQDCPSTQVFEKFTSAA